MPALPTKTSHHCGLCGRMVEQEDKNFYCDYDHCKAMKVIKSARSVLDFSVFIATFALFVLVGWAAASSIGTKKQFHDRHLNIQSLNDVGLRKYDSPFRAEIDMGISRKF